jgi:prophage antirepressor-like protein
MSWDVVLFNSRQNIKSIEDVEETMLEQTDFCSVLEKHFEEIIKDDNHREIKGNDFAIEYFTDDEKVSNKMLSLYGENGLYELVVLARKHNWQIFDTGLGQMIDLENPSNNGYANFQNYLKQILKK